MVSRLDGRMKSASSAAKAAAMLLVASNAASAAAPPTAPVPVSEFVVPGGPPPRLASSFPNQGAQVGAGVLVIKLVFDQPMAADGWSYGRSEGGDFPSCLAKPRLLADKRTFALLCSVAAHKTYAIAVNPAAAFAGANGRLAKADTLSFSTSDTQVPSLHDALEKAGLTDADEPIMTWKDDGAGVSRSPPPAP
jgi:hypothetical protein